MPGGRPPDIVLFMTDQQRRDQVGFASGGHFETPALDRLAAEGAVFDTAYSAAPVCVPARMSLLTGILPNRLPTEGASLALRQGHWTVAHALRGAGYETALIGKMHFTPVHAQHGFESMRLCEDLFETGGYPRGTRDEYGDWLVDHGYADWRATLWRGVPPDQATPLLGTFPHPAEAHPTGWIERETLEFLENRDPARPLFLVVSFPAPHPPYNPPEPYASMYSVEDAQLPADGFDVNLALPEPFLEALRAAPQQVGFELRTRRILTAIRGLVRQIDDAMGRITAALDLASSVCLFTSDHGDYSGHRGLLMKMPWIPFDDLARVALVVSGGGVVSRRVGEPVSTMDVPLTILELAGVQRPDASFDGRSLAPLLCDPAAALDPDRVVLCGSSSGWIMARRASTKLIGRWETGSAAVFDLDTDPGEAVDLGHDDAGRAIATELATAALQQMGRPPPDLPAA